MESSQLGYALFKLQETKHTIEEIISAAERVRLFIQHLVSLSTTPKNNDQLHTNRHEVVALQFETIHYIKLSFLVLCHEAKTFYQMMTLQTQTSF